MCFWMASQNFGTLALQQTLNSSGLPDLEAPMTARGVLEFQDSTSGRLESRADIFDSEVLSKNALHSIVSQNNRTQSENRYPEFHPADAGQP